MAEIKGSQCINVTKTLEAVHIAADLLFNGRRICLEAMKQPPFAPIDEIEANLTIREGTTLDNLDWDQKVKIATVAKVLYLALLSRAELQEIWSHDPYQVKLNVLANVNKDAELSLQPEDVDIKWGLLSMALVAKPEAFRQIQEAVGVKGTAAGFVTPDFIGPLGRVPIVRWDKETRQSIGHEDLHIFQDKTNPARHVVNMREKIKDPAILRAIENSQIQPGDLTKGFELLFGICRDHQTDIEAEVRTYTWNESFPHTPLDNPEAGETGVTLVACFNCIYDHNRQGVSDEQRIAETLTAISSVYEVNHFRNVLWHNIKAASTREGKSWSWAASRLLALPIPSSLNLYRTVLLGQRHAHLDDEPTMDKGNPLAQALITFARRKINPDSYGQGGKVTHDQVPTLINEIAGAFNNQTGLSAKELESTKHHLIRFAQKSVPKGVRGKIQRDLATLLSLFPLS
ncbi:hypothetical protein HY440_01865 [Candidatus Microgenomates bacterium]|nr:hypothetical protein [Candidatus Microgenomates bacterium]